MPDRVIGAHTHGDRLQLGMAGEDLPVPNRLSPRQAELDEAVRQLLAQLGPPGFPMITGAIAPDQQ
ncbi:hypothetical protein SCALM49S_00823 [Streptomyces californicus]